MLRRRHRTFKLADLVINRLKLGENSIVSIHTDDDEHADEDEEHEEETVFESESILHIAFQTDFMSRS
jgi:hypothetical protein